MNLNQIDPPFLAALKQNCRRYEAGLDALRQARGDRRAMATLRTKLLETQKLIRTIERDMAAELRKLSDVIEPRREEGPLAVQREPKRPRNARKDRLSSDKPAESSLSAVDRPPPPPPRIIGRQRMPLAYRRNMFDRLFRFAGKLRRHGPINVLSEARALGLSRKMLRRDFNLLRDMGWVIEFDKSQNSYVLLSAPPPRYF